MEMDVKDLVVGLNMDPMGKKQRGLQILFADAFTEKIKKISANGENGMDDRRAIANLKDLRAGAYADPQEKW